MKVPGDAGQTTLVAFVLDESGSMQGVKDDTIGGVNTYFATLKKETPEALVSLMLFSSRGDEYFRPLCSGVKVKDVPELTASNYQPSGNTPLRDAIGKAISDSAMRRADRYTIVIMTDGNENDSKEWTHEGVEKLIKEKQALDNWTIVFLASTVKAREQFVSMGGQHTNSMHYAGSGISGQSVGATFRSVAKATVARTQSPMASTQDFFKDAGQTEADYDAPKVVDPPKKRAPRKKS